MANRADIEDRKLTTRMFLGIVVIVVLLGAALIFFAGPMIAEAVAPGVGLRSAAMISFAVTLVVILVMALVAGEGIVGEIQFMIPGFAGFFIVLWLLIAWIF
jgi:hypothetical protein